MGCPTGKKQYDTKGAARAALHIARSRGIAGRGASYYRCRLCGKYHWGHRPTNASKALANRPNPKDYPELHQPDPQGVVRFLEDVINWDTNTRARGL